MYETFYQTLEENSLSHHGIKGMKWGLRRYQNPDGSLTPEGKKRYGYKGEATTGKAVRKAATAAVAGGIGARTAYSTVKMAKATRRTTATAYKTAKYMGAAAKTGRRIAAIPGISGVALTAVGASATIALGKFAYDKAVQSGIIFQDAAMHSKKNQK